MKKTVILDTNFLIAQFAHKLDVFQELDELGDDRGYRFELIVPSTVLDELSAIAAWKGKWAGSAAGALAMLKAKITRGAVKVMKTNQSVDPWIIGKASEKPADFVVCTNDRALRENLKKLGVKVILVRGQRKLFYS